MKIYNFSDHKSITQFSSRALFMSKIVNAVGNVHIGSMHIAPAGFVGYHRAQLPQLLVVVNGGGWVRAEGTERIYVTGGTAVFWQQGEWHEAGSDDGMSAIVIEAETLNPAAFMPKKEE